MIHRLTLENLKSFGGQHRVDLAPITLVYGPNSAGKSSLLQSLAVLKQSLEPRAVRIDVERQPLSLRGDVVDLGSFGAAVHGHDLGSKLGFAVEFSPGAPRAGVRPWLRNAAVAEVGLTFKFKKSTHTVEQHDVTLGSDGRRVRFVPSGPPPEAQQELFRSPEGYFRTSAAREDQTLRELILQSGRGIDEDMLEDLTRPYFAARGFFPGPLAPGQLRRRDREAQIMPPPIAANRIYETVYGPAAALISLLSHLAYLGPLRAAPTRFQARVGALYSTVGAKGEHTPLLLLQQPDLMRPVNDWLQQLGIHYELQIAPVEAESLGLEIGDLVVTRLIDRRSGIAVTPQDVGFGISQLLPVVVQTLAGRGRVVCIEQPEIHIHPRLQAEFADLLIFAARAHDNQMIVETHSEHLMLRLLRRLRESNGSDWLTAEKISVLYIDHDKTGRAVPRRLRLTDQGDFEDEWPHGFFSERLSELFSSSVPPSRPPARKRASR